MNSEEILRLAHSLRPELPTLVEEAATQTRFERLIADAESGTMAPTELLTELAQHPATWRWLSEHIQGEGARSNFAFGLDADSGFQQLPGQGAALISEEFVCPEPGCPSRWFRQRVGQPPPKCERHHKPLVLKTTA